MGLYIHSLNTFYLYFGYIQGKKVVTPMEYLDIKNFKFFTGFNNNWISTGVLDWRIFIPGINDNLIPVRDLIIPPISYIESHRGPGTMERYANRPVNPDYYGTVNLSDI